MYDGLIEPHNNWGMNVALQVLPTVSDTGTITFDDVDLTDTHTVSVASDIGNTLGGTLTLGGVSESAITSAGSVPWTYTVANSATQYLAAGQTASEVFTVTISDGQGATVTQDVTVVAYYGTTPLILDLNNDGVRTLGTDAGVQFDLTGLGRLASVGWSSPEDGFLVRDMNDDGLINDGTEMFGEATVLANGERAQDGFEALSDLDTNQDAVVDNQDEAFNSLAIWRDANTDGVTDAGELLTLAQHGIESLNLSYTESDRVDNGNQLRLVSSFTKTDGSQHEMVDVWLATFHENLSEAHMESALRAYVGAPEPTDRDASVSIISSSNEGTEADQSTIAMISAYNTTYEEDLINLESHKI